MKHSTTSNYRILILIVCLINVNNVFSQLTDWQNYTNQDWVNQILNDGDCLWIATDGGLVKMNKSTEKTTLYNRANAGLQDNHIVSLAKDKENNIWLGSKYNGICRFSENGVRVFNINNSGIQRNEFCTSIIVDDNNNKWIGSLLYLNKFNDKIWESWTSPLSQMYSTIWLITSMKFDEDSILWLGGEAGDWSFAKFAENEMQVLYDFGSVRGVEIDKDNNKWLATDHGLVKYDGENFTTFNSENSILPYDDLMDIKKDEEDNLWIVGGNYLIKYDGAEFVIYSAPLTKGNNWLTCIEIDDEYIWLGTRRDGLIRYKDNIFKQMNLTTSSLLSNNISYCSDIDLENNVWIGTEHNLIKIDSDDHWNSLFEKKEDNTENRVLGVNCAPSGDMWIALGRSDTCVLKMNANNTIAFTKQNTPWFGQIPDDQSGVFSEFAFDKKGNVWLASRLGLFKYDGNKWDYFSPDNSPLPDYQINSLAIDKDDNLWVGIGRSFGGSGGLCKYDGTDWTIYTMKNSGLPTLFVAIIRFDSKNVLWLSCRDAHGGGIGRIWGGGLTRFDGTSWTSYNIENSKIPSNTIMDIAIDKNDHLWLATYGHVGITEYDGTNWVSYNIENSGIAWDEVSKITLDYGRDLIWLNHLNNSGISTAKLNWNESSIENPVIDAGRPSVVYPNPAKDEIGFHLKEGENIYKVEVYNIAGKLICCKNLSSNTVGLSYLNICHKGLYLIKVFTSQEKYYSERLMVL